MDTVIVLIIIVSVTYYIALPYFKMNKTPHSRLPARDNKSANLQRDYSNTLATIKELEFDHTIGNLSYEDFSELNTQYRHEAIGLLKQMDSSKSRNKAKRKHKNETSMVQTELNSNTVSFCSQCGIPVGKKYRFCSKCGNQLR